MMKRALSTWFMCVAVAAGVLTIVLAMRTFAAASVIADPTPRLGILVPIGPPDYAVLIDALNDRQSIQDGPYTYQTGTISGVAVVLIIQPSDGDVIRSLGAQEMLRALNVRALIYPGTSGAQLSKGEMGIGDIVLGAKTINNSSYYISPSGAINPGQYAAVQPDVKHYGEIYADPKVLGMLACAANRVAASTTLPGWLENTANDGHPGIFYFGAQGSSTIWSDNLAYTKAIRDVYHQVDEDGDWDSALVATLWNVPFIEVSVISDSIFAFPNDSHGVPRHPAGETAANVVAQRLSDRIVLDLIARDGRRLLAGTYANSLIDPYSADAFARPHDPQALLSTCQHEAFRASRRRRSG
jgi:adenosylhomocysteine nucleosidase